MSPRVAMDSPGRHAQPAGASCPDSGFLPDRDSSLSPSVYSAQWFFAADWASGLLRRKRVAWMLTLGFLAASIWPHACSRWPIARPVSSCSIGANGVIHDLPGASQQTLLMFFSQDNAGPRPTQPFARLFVDSIDQIGGLPLFYWLLMLPRPVLLRGEPATQEQRQIARAIIEK